MNLARILIAIFALGCVVLAGCSSSGSARRGGYYQNDGPGSGPPPDLAAIPDAVPRIETQARATSRPYTIFGKRYVPISAERPFRQEGVASWYGRQFHGNKTANGEIYDMYAMTAAHPTLPIPSYARVTRVNSGQSIIVRINDRGPFHSSRVIDLSYVAAAKLGLIGPGSGRVVVEAITNADIARGIGTRTARAAPQPTPQPAAVQPAPAPAQAPEFHPAPVAVLPTPDALSVMHSAGEPSRTDIVGEGTGVTDTMQTVTIQADDITVATVGGTASAGALASPVYLQFGAFSTPENAQSLAHRLNQQITQSESGPVSVQNADNLYKVRMGPYASRGEAVNAAWLIRQQTGAQPSLATR